MIETIYLSDLNIWTLFSNSIYLLFLLSMYFAIKEKRTFEFFTSFSILLLLIYLLKYSFAIPRPEPYNYLKDSFPSLHAAIAFFSFYFLHEKFPISFAWALGVALSRIILGLHRAMDVFIGSFIGLLVPLLISKNKDHILNVLDKKEGEIIRKLIHASYFLSLAFLLLINKTYFLFYLIISTIFIIIHSLVKYEFEHSLLKPINKALRSHEKEKFNLALIYPQVLILVLFNFINLKIILAILLALAFYDFFASFINLFLKNYIVSASFSIIINFLLFLIIFDFKFSLISSIAILLADFLSKKYDVDDNYLIPLFVFIFLIIF